MTGGGAVRTWVTGPKVTSGELAKRLHADKSLEIDDMWKTLRISGAMFYRYLRL